MNLITPSFGLIFWQTIIFFLMFFIFSKFAWKPILNFIEKREKYINLALFKAKEARNELYCLQFNKEHWIKESNLQRDYLLKNVKKKNNLLRLGAIQKDKNDNKKTILQVKSLIDKEKKEAKIYIKNCIAHLAINIAKKILNKEIKKDKEQKYIIFSLKKVNALDKVKFCF